MMKLQTLACIASLFAAWSSMGTFCLRTRAIRHRYAWHAYGPRERYRKAGVGTTFCLLALALAWTGMPASFAVIMWVVELGVVGAGIALLLPYWTRATLYTFAVSRVGTVLSTIGLALIYFAS